MYKGLKHFEISIIEQRHSPSLPACRIFSFHILQKRVTRFSETVRIAETNSRKRLETPSSSQGVPYMSHRLYVTRAAGRDRGHPDGRRWPRPPCFPVRIDGWPLPRVRPHGERPSVGPKVGGLVMEDPDVWHPKSTRLNCRALFILWEGTPRPIPGLDLATMKRLTAQKTEFKCTILFLEAPNCWALGAATMVLLPLLIYVSRDHQYGPASSFPVLHLMNLEFWKRTILLG